jgi:hypothetical protein
VTKTLHNVCFNYQCDAKQEMTDWLRAKDIIGGLLRANLHLAQYVAQVCCQDPRLVLHFSLHMQVGSAPHLLVWERQS